MRSWRPSTARTGRPAGLTGGVTHSPVLRACALAHLGHDLGEPEWLTGLELSVPDDRSLAVCRYPATEPE